MFEEEIGMFCLPVLQKPLYRSAEAIANGTSGVKVCSDPGVSSKVLKSSGSGILKEFLDT